MHTLFQHHYWLKGKQFFSPVLLISLFHAIAFGILDITFPLYLRELGGSVAILGVASAIFGAMKLVAALSGGYLSDIVGKRKMMKVSLCFFALAGAIWYASTTTTPLLIGKFMQGIAGGFFWVTLTALLEDSTKEKASTYGFMESSRALVALLAVLLTGYMLTQISLRSTMAIFSIIFLGSLLFSFLRLNKKNRRQRVKKPALFTDMKIFLLEKNGLLLLPTIIAMGAYESFVDFIPLYAVDIGMTYIELGMLKMLTLAGFIFIPFISGRYSDLHSRKTPIIIGAALAGACFLTLNIAEGMLVFALFFLLSFAVICCQPTVIALVNDNLKPAESGRFNGVLISLNMIALIVSSLINGVLIDAFGYTYMFTALGILFLFASAYTIIHTPDSHTTRS